MLVHAFPGFGMPARAIACGGLRFAGEQDKYIGYDIGYASVCQVKMIEAIKGTFPPSSQAQA